MDEVLLPYWMVIENSDENCPTFDHVNSGLLPEVVKAFNFEKFSFSDSNL